MAEYDPVAHQSTIERFRQCEDPDMWVTALKQQVVIWDEMLAQTLINIRTGKGRPLEDLEEQGFHSIRAELENWIVKS